MLGKTLILGLISAGVAGTIVYYGTAPQGSEALEAPTAGGATVETSIKKERERIEPRLPTVRNAESEDGRKKLASSASLPKSAEKMPVETTGAEPKQQTRWLDQYLKNNTSDTAENAVPDSNAGEPELKPSKSSASDSAVNSYTVNEAAIISDVEPEVQPEANINANVTDRRTFRIENGKLVEMNSEADEAEAKDMAKMEEAEDASEMPDKMMAEEKGRKVKMLEKAKAHKFTSDVNQMASDTTPLLATVMKEAAAIEKPELRDQAYFEITEFALSEGRYNSARLAHDMIKQDELSYTAKSRIAVAYAQNGQPTKAFKVIGEVDEAELRDFMRLQVIEALIAPENLPPSWQ